jgi:hypothetical protein
MYRAMGAKPYRQKLTGRKRLPGINPRNPQAHHENRKSPGGAPHRLMQHGRNPLLKHGNDPG